MKKLLVFLVFSIFCSAETHLDTQKPSIIKVGTKGWCATLLGGLALWGVADSIEKKSLSNLVFGLGLGCLSYACGRSAYSDYQLR